MISADQIRSTYDLLVPYIRRTPVIDIDGTDFNLRLARLSLKLESLQHAGPSRRAVHSRTC